MNVNKKLDRFRQWGKEKVGASGDKTDTPEGFKALEAEMDLRHQGKPARSRISVEMSSDAGQAWRSSTIRQTAT